MTCNFNVTVDEFKALFTRDFPYLPEWVYGKAYFINDVVYLDGNFYQSKTDGNTDQPPSENWQLYNDNENNYISDNDISRAFVEAKINFNPQMFSCEAKSMVFCYLAAHYLVIDLNNAQNPLALGFMGFTQSKSVGSVSESYGLPQWVMSNPKLSLYAQTGYGRKYLSLIQPYLTGNIIFTPGAINFR